MELCNDIWTLHVFCLRCSTLQDVVQLIEELETACIRFVHFSKENELRSRVSAYTRQQLSSCCDCLDVFKWHYINKRQRFFKVYYACVGRVYAFLCGRCFPKRWASKPVGTVTYL